ncbi:tRNA pseudouridine(55) synthase TruB [Brachybacterium alimentarium]|uniref:tRNA pseudouridine(55) synthase TruB n=1 Tax=Brachybacterium alimentarium TaxID=47845 RepID=UPI000BB8ACB9|nr:tRNA pseudouridine(55) synthase TruB [Brachybacterium alimentarium]PCC34896.1 tRNA pseudouridine(55) synthase TruB [Brachybacterium alimentarium]RCS82938.1 tRNA pseudouridine(55) synthase TruB [Brachybacterium alimentarium]
MSAPHSSAPHGILLVDKAPDRTSHDVVARVRWLLHTKKVGHAGTLDPMATGLLILGIGQGTRLLTHLVGLDKTYEATIRLGRSTVTDDREGEAIGEHHEATGLTDAEIEAQLQQLRGDIQQVPSTVSAIKVDGQRAYARARAGEDVQLAARPVRISRFEITARRETEGHLDLDAVVTCSSGTYVRALARDLGAALDVGGHLLALRRTSVGPFSVDGALHVPARGEGDDVELPLPGLGETAGRVLPVLTVDEQAARELADGKRIARDQDPSPASASEGEPSGPRPARGADDLVAALDPSGALCAVLRPDGAHWRPVLVVPLDARC